MGNTSTGGDGRSNRGTWSSKRKASPNTDTRDIGLEYREDYTKSMEAARERYNRSNNTNLNARQYAMTRDGNKLRRSLRSKYRRDKRR